MALRCFSLGLFDLTFSPLSVQTYADGSLRITSACAVPVMHRCRCALNQASSEWKFFTAHQAALVNETAVEEEGDAKINGRPIA